MRFIGDLSVTCCCIFMLELQQIGMHSFPKILETEETKEVYKER